MITVIIPTINDPYLKKTVTSLWETSEGQIEIIVANDGGTSPVDVNGHMGVRVINYINTVGRRVAINDAATLASGDYLFILDSHCKMTKGWDTKLLQAVQPRSIVVCAIQDMDPETWEPIYGQYHHCYINKDFEEKWWHQARKPVEEMMCFTGCAWLIPKRYFQELGGYDESLGKYGWDGPEWAMKVWLDGNGKVFLRSDVICYHIFGTNEGDALYEVETIGRENWTAYAKKRWGQKINWLLDKFREVEDIPSWETVEKESTMPKQIPIVKTGEKKRVYVHTIRKVDKVEYEEDGKVIKIEKWHYKPFKYKTDVPLTDEEKKANEAKYLHDITEVERIEECPLPESS